MAVSNDTTWTMTQASIVNAAFRKIGIGVDGSTATATQITNANEALNNLVFSLYAQGMPVWAMTTTFFTMTEGIYQYPVGLTTGTQTNLIIPAPLKITQAWNLDVINPNAANRIPMNIYTQYNYQLLTSPNVPGTPIHLWYQPLNQTGVINLWPAPDSYSATNRQMWFTYQRPFDQFDNTTDTPDFPQVWLEPLIYSLAHRMAPEFGLPLSEIDKLNETANELIQNALSFGTEEGALFIQPDWVALGSMDGSHGY